MPIRANAREAHFHPKSGSRRRLASSTIRRTDRQRRRQWPHQYQWRIPARGPRIATSISKGTMKWFGAMATERCPFRRPGITRFQKVRGSHYSGRFHRRRHSQGRDGINRCMYAMAPSDENLGGIATFANGMDGVVLDIPVFEAPAASAMPPPVRDGRRPDHWRQREGNPITATRMGMRPGLHAVHCPLSGARHATWLTSG